MSQKMDTKHLSKKAKEKYADIIEKPLEQWPIRSFYCKDFAYHQLFSGSPGNMNLLQTKTTSYLIDFGMSYKRFEACLGWLSETLREEVVLLISHKHTDHMGVGAINRLKTVLGKRLKAMYLGGWVFGRRSEVSTVVCKHGSIKSTVFRIADHLVYITDVDRESGYVTLMQKADKLRGVKLFVIEANYDEERLLEIMNQNDNPTFYSHSYNITNAKARHLIDDAAYTIVEFVKPDNVMFTHWESRNKRLVNKLFEYEKNYNEKPFILTEKDL